jgi:hypothetical protein
MTGFSTDLELEQNGQEEGSAAKRKMINLGLEYFHGSYDRLTRR